jgi:hypothetical protein
MAVFVNRSKKAVANINNNVKIVSNNNKWTFQNEPVYSIYTLANSSLIQRKLKYIIESPFIYEQYSNILYVIILVNQPKL